MPRTESRPSERHPSRVQCHASTWGVLVLGALLLIACTDQDIQGGATATLTPSRIGEPVRLSQDRWILTVTGVNKDKTATPPLQGVKEALGIYIQVSVSMENTASEAQTLGSNRIALVDRLGRRYEPYYAGGEVGSRINPGLKAHGYLVFDVPPEATGLTLTSLGGFRVALPDAEAIPLKAIG